LGPLLYGATYFLVIVQAALLIKYAIFGDTNRNITLVISVGSSIAMPILGILSLSLLSMIEGFILFAIKDIIAHKEMEFRSSLSNAIAVLKPLMIFNVLIAVLAYIPSLLFFPNTILSFLSPEPAPWGYSSLLPVLSDIFRYINSVVTAFTFCIPFIVILRNCGFIEAFKNNYDFISHNFVKYLTFIGIGILLLFLPSLIGELLHLFVRYFTILRFLIDMLMAAIEVLFAVIFYIAMFNLILDISSTLQVQNVITETDAF
jgi:hypothetical protein